MNIFVYIYKYMHIYVRIYLHKYIHSTLFILFITLSVYIHLKLGEVCAFNVNVKFSFIGSIVTLYFRLCTYLIPEKNSN